MRAPLQVLLVAAALAAPIAPGVAAAGKPPSTSEQYAAAEKLFDQGRYEEALALFREVHAASKSPNARLWVARTLRELGRLPEAYEEMSLTVREAGERAEKYAPTRDAAASELAVLERRVGRVVIAIADAPSGVTVTLDGAELDASRVGEPIAVNPGKRTITVTAPGRDAVERSVVVSAGEIKTVALAIAGEETASGPTPEPTPPLQEEEEKKSSGGGVRTAGYVVTGLGVAGMALFGVAGLMANSKFKTLETECGGTRCTDPKYAETIDSGRTMDNLANVGLIAGAAGLVLGGAMIVLGGPSDDQEEASRGRPRAPSATAAITFSPGGAGVRCAFTF